MKSLVASFARNTVFANILLAIILLAGGMAVFSMVREAFPEVPLDLLSVTVPWPGADPEEVEEGICRKIEEAIEGIDGIKEINTMSREHVGVAQIEVHEDYDLNAVKERVRNVVEAISTFPVDAEKPVLEEVLFRDEVMMISLGAEEMDERQLKEWAEQIKEEIRSLPEVSQVQVLGVRDYEIAIEVSEEQLRQYGLSFNQVAQIVRGNSINLSGGTMRTEGEEIRLRTLGRRYTASEFADIVVLARPGGDVVTLDRIATIRDDFTEDRVIALFNGEPVVTVMVLKTTEEDTLAIDKAVRAYLAEREKLLPAGVHAHIWGGHVDILRARIRLLTRNGLIGLTLVFILLWLFLDIRLSFWAGMGMPISVAGALAIMWGMGATINMISLFGLIMVLGVIVDDAIVVGEAIYVARKNGAAPLLAAVEGVLEVGMPVIAAVTTTIVAFIPLYFVGGMMGKFISVLPLVVISCLLISLVECLILLPAHLNHLPAFEEKDQKGHRVRRLGLGFHRFMNRGLEWVIAHAYHPFVHVALRWRYVCIAIAVAVLLVTKGFMDSGYLKFHVFPKVEGNRATAQVEFPNGTPLHVTKAAIEQIDAAIKRVDKRTPTLTGEPLVQHSFSLVGRKLGGGLGSHLGSVRLELLDAEARGVFREDVLVDWEQEVGAIPGAVSLTFSGGRVMGGAPIEVWLQGHQMDSILAAAEEVKAKLATYEGVYQIEHDFRPGKNELKLQLKPEARALGLTVADLARQVYAGYFGEQAIRIQRGRDDIRVRVRYPADERNKVAEFEKVRIRTPQGLEVPLLSVADIAYGPGYATINRTDGMRRVAVTAEIDEARANANEVVNDLNTGFFPSLATTYPEVSVALKGEKKDMAESFGSLFITYPIALLGIFIIVATVFRSYLQPLVIMVTVPFGIIGAIIGHVILGYDLSMMSFFGMVALSGVVVNDAIVLIECINTFIANGTPFAEAIAKGGARRFRAIFLTSVSTVGGLTPLLMEQDRQAQFLIPMAVSLAAGVAFATLLTLLLVPCLLIALNDLRRVAHWLAFREWPSPEEVEPASRRYEQEEDDGQANGQPGTPSGGTVPEAG